MDSLDVGGGVSAGDPQRAVEDLIRGAVAGARVCV